jgi:4-amino-4-deoxy-L-arabinose transferase-like glycosyltransferase
VANSQDASPHGRWEHGIESLWRAYLLALLGAAGALRVMMAPRRYFSQDESQHLHGAFCIAQGLVPFRDYFEHHTPWFPYLLSWVYPIWADSVETILAARYLMVVLSAGIVYLTYRLGRALHGTEAGLLASVLLVFMMPFAEKTVEIRPDVPEVACWLAGLWALVHGIRNEHLRSYLLAGLAFGSALMFSQKAVFGVTGVVGTLLWTSFCRRTEPAWRAEITSTAALLAGVAAPIGLTLVFLWWQGALGPFIEYSVLMNARWKYTFSPLVYILQIIRQCPLQAAFGFCGWIAAVQGLLRFGPRKSVVAPLVGGALGLMLGLVVLPVPYLQYFQLLLPLWCIFAAHNVLRFSRELATGVTGSGRVTSRWALRLAPIAIVFAACLALSATGLKDARPAWSWSVLLLALPIAWLPAGWRRGIALATWLAFGYIATPFGSIGVLVLLPVLLLTAFAAATNVARYVAAMLLAAALVQPLIVMSRQAIVPGNARTLEVVQYVLDHSTLHDTVLTSWRGAAPFRHHAYFYFFLHEELQLMIGRDVMSAQIARVLDERPPKIVILDQWLAKLDPRLLSRIVRDYEKKLGVVHVRRRVATD